MAEAARRYRAFISYSQVDTKPAQRLHRALENYRVPLGIAPDVVRKDRRLGRFFRDMDEMGAATDISATVRGAIDDSDSLIVVCSPRSAKSIWVETEIQHFRKTGRGDRIYAVIIDGVPNSGDPETECFPGGLRVAFREDGMPIEPVGIDLRRESLNRAYNRIAAGLLGVPFDALWRRSRREFHRRLMLAGGAAAGVAAVAAGIMVMIWSGQAREAGALRSEQLAEAARAASDQGDYARAVRYAAAGLRGADNLLTGFAAPDAEVELRRAMQGDVLYALHEDVPPARSDDTYPTFTSVAFSPDGTRFVVGAGNGKALVRDAASGKLVAALEGHKDGVEVSFSPDGARILTVGAGDEGLAILWDAKTFAKIATLPNDKGQTRNASFSADSSRLITGSAQQTVRVWDAASGRMLWEIATPYTLQNVALSPNGAEAIAQTTMDLVLRWDAATGRKTSEMKLRRWESPLFSPDRRQFLSIAPASPTIDLKDAAGKRIRSFTNAQHAVASLAFSPDGQRIVVGAFDGSIDVYETATARVLASWTAYSDAVSSVTFSADGRRILSGADLEPPAVWTADGAWLADLGLATSGRPDAFAISADGSRGVTATRDGVVTMWTLDPSEREIILQSDDTADHDQGRPAFSADGKLLAVDDGFTNVSIWNLATGKREALLKGGDGVAAPQTWLAFSPDGTQLLTLRQDGGWTLWTIASGQAVTHAPADVGIGLGMMWGPSGARVLVQDKDGARIWDAVSGRPVGVLPSPQGFLTEAVFSPDGKLVATATVGTDGLEDPGALNRARFVTVSEVDTGKMVTALQGHTEQVFYAVFSPDSRTIATASGDNTVRIWDAASGAQKRKFDGLRPTARPVFSPDGKRLAFGNLKAVTLITLEDGRVDVLNGHADAVTDVAFSPDSRLLVSVSADTTARVWDLGSRRQLAKFSRAGGVYWFAAFAFDGRLVVGATSGDIHVSPLPAVTTMPREQLVSRACSAMLLGEVSRFTPDELKAVPLLDATRDADACGR